MKRVLILGAGDHGQVVADILLAAARAGAEQMPVGLLDDDEALTGRNVLGLPVLGTLAERGQFEHDAVIVAIGSNLARRRVCLALREQGVEMVNAIHPTACVASAVRLGSGVMISAGAIVETGAIVGDGVIINTNCLVGHHCRVGDYAHISGGSAIGGHVQIGEGAMVGLGGTILPGLSIGSWSLVAMGSAATKDIPAHCVALGVPARIVQWNHAPSPNPEAGKQEPAHGASTQTVSAGPAANAARG